MKKKSNLLILLLMLPVVAFSQYPSRYFIQFTDKNNNGYNINNPSAFLSARAVARRTNQNIGYDFKDLPVTQAYVDSLAAHGATILNKTKWFNGVTIETLDTNVLNSILALPFVVNAHSPVGRFASHGKGILPIGFLQREYLLRTNISAPTQRMEQVKSLNYGSAYNQIHLINGDYLHNMGYMGEGMVIGVLDAGYLHADTMAGFDSIRNNNKILGTRNFVQSINNDVYQDHWHGCMVLSLMGGNWPGMIVGTAPHASYWLIVTEDANSENVIEEYNWASGAEFADSVGVDIITTSLGYTQFDHSEQNHSFADMNGHTTTCAKAAAIAAERGILVLAAAGNDGNNAWHHISTPADADSILAVGAVDASRNYATFSSVGYSSDGRVKPDVADQGAGTTVMDPVWSANSLNTNGNGTSFATPILAGAAACLWQAHPTMNAMQIRRAIIESASQYTNPDTLLGYGIPNFALASSFLTGVPSNTSDNLLNVYPNPFSQSINYEFYSDTSQTIVVTILNALGKVIFQEKHPLKGACNYKFSIPNVSNESKGIYILQIQSDKFLFTRKLVKI